MQIVATASMRFHELPPYRSRGFVPEAALSDYAGDPVRSRCYSTSSPASDQLAPMRRDFL